MFLLFLEILSFEKYHRQSRTFSWSLNECPVPFIPRDGTGSGRDFQDGTGLCLRGPQSNMRQFCGGPKTEPNDSLLVEVAHCLLKLKYGSILDVSDFPLNYQDCPIFWLWGTYQQLMIRPLVDFALA